MITSPILIVSAARFVVIFLLGLLFVVSLPTAARLRADGGNQAAKAISSAFGLGRLKAQSQFRFFALHSQSSAGRLQVRQKRIMSFQSIFNTGHLRSKQAPDFWQR